MTNQSPTSHLSKFQGIVTLIQEIFLSLKMNSTLILRVYKYSANHKFSILISSILSIILTYLKSLNPKYSGVIIDAVIEGNADRVYDGCLGVLICLLTISILNHISDSFSKKTNLKILNEAKLNFFEKILQKDVEFFENHKTGDLISKMNSDISCALDVSTSDLLSLIRNFFKLAICLYILSKMSMILTLIYLGFSLVITKINADIVGMYRACQKEKSDLYGDLNHFILEIFSNVKIVKAFSTESFEKKSLEKKYDKIHEITEQINSKTNNMSIILELLERIRGAFTIIFAGMLAIDGSLSAGEVSALFMYTDQIDGCLSLLKRLHTSYGKSLNACKIIFNLLDHQIKLSNSGDFKPKVMDGEINFKNVSFSYPSRPEVLAINNINFKIKSGETIGIVGASGSGKSTMVGLLQRYFDPSSGKVYVDNQDIKNFDVKLLTYCGNIVIRNIFFCL